MTHAARPHGADASQGGWRERWRAAHFHDYTPAALRMWLGITLAGAAALLAALAAFVLPGGPDPLTTLVALTLVAIAAWFPITIPRTKYSVSAADVFIFTSLAMLGPPAAVLASGVEGLIGSWRGTRRLTSRISTPAAAMAAMSVCGLLFNTLWGGLAAHGWSAALAKLAALLAVGLVPFVMTTLALMSTVTLKRHVWPDLREWFSGLGWLAAVYLAAALVAGMVQLNANEHGLAAIGVVAVAALAVVFLLRASIAHHEAEHQSQEVRISDAEREAALNQQRFAAAFTHAAIGMAIVDAQGRVVRANQALHTLLGRSTKQP